MNVMVPRDSLLDALQAVIGVVERRHTIPILSHVLLSFSDQSLSVTATDIEIELVYVLVLDEPVAQPTALTIPARKLLDICRALPASSLLSFELSASRAVVRCGRSRFSLSALPADDFPSLAPLSFSFELDLPEKELHSALMRAHIAMADQDVRYFLNGVSCELRSNQLFLAATDGHRFALSALALETAAPNKQLILPRKGVLELLRLLKQEDGPIQLSLTDHHVRISGRPFTFTSRLIDGRFPDYQPVLIKNPPIAFVVDRDLVKQSLQRVSVLADEKMRIVRLGLKADVLELIANNPSSEEAQEECVVESSCDSSVDLQAGYEIFFNVGYLLDVLSVMPQGNVRFALTADKSRLSMESVPENGSLFIVMPLQV